MKDLIPDDNVREQVYQRILTKLDTLTCSKQLAKVKMMELFKEE